MNNGQRQAVTAQAIANSLVCKHLGKYSEKSGVGGRLPLLQIELQGYIRSDQGVYKYAFSD